MDGVLVRYGEIGIKSAPVRRQMQGRLRNNLMDALLREGVEGNVSDLGPRLWMVGPDIDALARIATKTFGVVSASPVVKVGSSMEQIAAAASELALQHEWSTFAVRARRQGQHGFTSQDVGIQVGSAIYTAAEAAGRTPKVDLVAPELEVFVEVRGDGAFIATQHLDGPGGIPTGSQGRVAVLMSDTHSAVAAWYMMRRGCKVFPIHAGDMGSAPIDIIEPLQSWGLGDEVIVLPVCSRAVTKMELTKAAQRVARDKKCSALVTGDTIDSALVAGDLPVLRPVCGLSPREVQRIIDLVGLPDEDGPDLLVSDGGDPAEELLRLKQVVTV